MSKYPRELLFTRLSNQTATGIRAWTRDELYESPQKETAVRRFAVADIHGCSQTFRKLVEEGIRLTKCDTLYLLGDYIDRGPDSKGVLDCLMQFRSAGYDIRPIRGNHEQLLLDAISDPEARRIWYGCGGWATMKEFGADSPDEIPQQYISYVAGLPRILTTDNYILVHAGLDFNTKDPLNDTLPESMLWIRDYQVDSGKIDGRTLVTGHTVTPLFAIKASLATKHILLDNGCYDKGEMCCGAMVALDLDTRELLVQENIEECI